MKVGFVDDLTNKVYYVSYTDEGRTTGDPCDMSATTSSANTKLPDLLLDDFFTLDANNEDDDSDNSICGYMLNITSPTTTTFQIIIYFDDPYLGMTYAG